MAEPIRSSGRRRAKPSKDAALDTEYRRIRMAQEARTAEIELAAGWDPSRGPAKKKNRQSRRKGHNK
jgi:hypothetical protein